MEQPINNISTKEEYLNLRHTRHYLREKLKDSTWLEGSAIIKKIKEIDLVLSEYEKIYDTTLQQPR